MIDTTAATLALRNRALSLTVCTTGSTSLAQTTTGFTRSAGSFVTDGFKPGMEVTPAGFATNTVGIITAVSALSLTVNGTRNADPETAGRTLSVGFPALRAFENIDFQPVAGRPYVTEQFIQGGGPVLKTITAASGTVEETGIYVLTWYGLANYGLSIRACVDALKALYAPGTSLAVGSDTLRVRADLGPFTGQMIRQDGGWMALTLTIPWRAWTTNAIAA